MTIRLLSRPTGAHWRSSRHVAAALRISGSWISPAHYTNLTRTRAAIFVRVGHRTANGSPSVPTATPNPAGPRPRGNCSNRPPSMLSNRTARASPLDRTRRIRRQPAMVSRRAAHRLLPNRLPATFIPTRLQRAGPRRSSRSTSKQEPSRPTRKVPALKYRRGLSEATTSAYVVNFGDKQGLWFTNGKNGPSGALRYPCWSPDGKTMVYHKSLHARTRLDAARLDWIRRSSLSPPKARCSRTLRYGTTGSDSGSDQSL